jgi:ATP-binding cassette subfamily B protein
MKTPDKTQRDVATPSMPAISKRRQYDRGRRGGEEGGAHMGPGPIGMPGEKPKEFSRTAIRLLKYMKPHGMAIVLMVILSVLATIIIVVAPEYQRLIINSLQTLIIDGIGSVSATTIRQWAILLFSLYVIRFLFDLVASLLGNRVSNIVGRQMREELREKMERLPIRYFDGHQTGNILSVFSNDVDTVSGALQQSLIYIISSAIIIIGSIVMMIRISWVLTLIALLALPLYILATTTIAKKSQKKFIAQQRELGNLNGYIEEMFTSQKVIKLYGKEQDSFVEFAEINDSLATNSQGAQYVSGLIRPIMDFISNVVYVAVVTVGGILTGATTPLLIGDITTFVAYQQRFVNPILNIAGLMSTLQSTIAGAERIFEFLDAGEETPDRSETLLDPACVTGEVVFENVDFTYSPDKELIRDLNLHVEPGKQIAIVGPTGAGKTTIVNLMMRFYDIQSGRITIDGKDYRDVPRTDLRHLFGMVLQDTWLFSGTIGENIAYGKIGATHDEIVEASRQAHVDHFIDTLPQGYDTVLTEDAANISQGQKQLLTIARAILADPKILILDEATSSVDTRTEAYIQNAMKYMMQNRTSFVIAHRLSTIKNAAVILVMDNGRIVEQGTHRELLESHGFYAELYNAQFANPIA